ncbi:hypothetical protein ISCGN_027564 [Ixodes scapularis]
MQLPPKFLLVLFWLWCRDVVARGALFSVASVGKKMRGFAGVAPNAAILPRLVLYGDQAMNRRICKGPFGCWDADASLLTLACKCRHFSVISWHRHLKCFKHFDEKQGLHGLLNEGALGSLVHSVLLLIICMEWTRCQLQSSQVLQGLDVALYSSLLKVSWLSSIHFVQ